MALRAIEKKKEIDAKFLGYPRSLSHRRYVSLPLDIIERTLDANSIRHGALVPN